MIWVIGSSASAEYAIKAGYETIIGRLTDTHEVATDEDKFNASYTQDYVNFIKDRPWYEFNFNKQLSTLWSSTSFFGDHFLRKLERKYFLTSELLVKSAYGKLIGLGTKTVYDAAVPTTAVLVDSILPNNLSLDIIKKYDDGSALLSLPRYDQFNPAICELAKNGFSFREIAGNNSAILLTVLVSSGTELLYENAQPVFKQPITSDIATQRIAIAVPVKDLNKLLVKLDRDKIKIEHIFDY